MFRFFSVQTLLKRTAKDRPTAAEAVIFAPKKSSTELLHVTMGPCLEAVPIATLAAFLKLRKALQHEFVAEKVEKPPEPVDTEPILRAFLNCFLSLQVFKP